MRIKIPRKLLIKINRGIKFEFYKKKTIYLNLVGLFSFFSPLHLTNESLKLIMEALYQNEPNYKMLSKIEYFLKDLSRYMPTYKHT